MNQKQAPRATIRRIRSKSTKQDSPTGERLSRSSPQEHRSQHRCWRPDRSNSPGGLSMPVPRWRRTAPTAESRAAPLAHKRASASAAPDDRFRAPGDPRLASAWATRRSLRSTRGARSDPPESDRPRNLGLAPPTLPQSRTTRRWSGSTQIASGRPDPSPGSPTAPPLFKCWTGRCQTCRQPVDLVKLLLHRLRHDE